MSTVPTTALSLDRALSILTTADRALAGWRAKHTDVTTGDNYVRSGHDTIKYLDALTRELHQVREALVGEIYDDEIDRAARVDALLAQIRAERAEREGQDREEPTGAPLPSGVEGHPMGRSTDR